MHSFISRLIAKPGRASKTELQVQIRNAVDLHDELKAQIFNAIEVGHADLNTGRLSKDDQCDLGLLLYDRPDLCNVNPGRYQRVRRIHKEWHKHAGTVLTSAIQGKHFEACRLAAPNSPFAQACSSLNDELTAWCKEID